MNVDVSDPRVLAAAITAAVALLALVVGRVYELVRDELRRRAVRQNLIRALFAEIDFNTRDMQIFREKSPDMGTLGASLRGDRGLVPHITDARHTEFYRNRIQEIHHVPDELISRVVHFYGLLEKLRVQIDAVGRPSFGTISPDGRVRVVETIFETAQDCELAGGELMERLTRRYARLRLTRLDRPEASHDRRARGEAAPGDAA